MNTKCDFISIKNIIIKKLEDIGIFIDSIEEDLDIREYGLDSVGYINLICDIEMEFNIEFPDEYLNIQTVVSLNNITSLVLQIINV